MAEILADIIKQEFAQYRGPFVGSWNSNWKSGTGTWILLLETKKVRFLGLGISDISVSG